MRTQGTVEGLKLSKWERRETNVSGRDFVRESEKFQSERKCEEQKKRKLTPPGTR
jgi:hypothetical protein